jgi:hypothetical protein
MTLASAPSTVMEAPLAFDADDEPKLKGDEDDEDWKFNRLARVEVVEAGAITGMDAGAEPLRANVPAEYKVLTCELWLIVSGRPRIENVGAGKKFTIKGKNN